MDTSGVEKEQAIKELVEEQRELLIKLVVSIDNLVDRNPRPECGVSSIAQNPDNVFDEIRDTLQKCRGLIREATEKVDVGIARKVH